MTPKQILDSFSETLVRDERILSTGERALVTTLLQHARAATGENQEIQEAVRTVIASAIGETVAQRAFAVLGGSIVQRILLGDSLPLGDSAEERPAEIYAREPQPPSGPGPHVKAPPKAPQPPASPMRTPGEPQPPSGPGPHAVRTVVVSETSAAVAERPSALPARCVVLDEFLAPQELEELMHFTLERESAFSASEVVSPSADGGVVNYEHRRSRVLTDLEHHQGVMLARIKAVLPQVLNKLGMEEFSIAQVEAQVTASNDGDFFHFHSDNGSDRVASRHLTFVYFFQREPRQFEGGELRIHDARLADGTYISQGTYQAIVPQQNQIVFFPCELLHEITPVRCASQRFADSRFTLNGWLRR
jgi:SM-20-related protein